MPQYCAMNDADSNESVREQEQAADAAEDGTAPRTYARVEVVRPDGTSVRLEGDAAMRYLDEGDVLQEVRDVFGFAAPGMREAVARLDRSYDRYALPVFPSLFDEVPFRWPSPFRLMPSAAALLRMVDGPAVPSVPPAASDAVAETAAAHDAADSPAEEPPPVASAEDSSSQVREVLVRMASDEELPASERAAATAALSALEGPDSDRTAQD